MELSVCIPTHNQPDLLPLSVESCLRESARAGVEAEVIIIDNASATGYPQKIAEAHPTVRVIRNEENLSFSSANNQGIRAARGRYVLILNDDAILQPGSLGRLLETLEASPAIGAVGARLVNPDGSPQIGYMHDRSAHVRGVLCLLLQLNVVLAKREWSRKLFTFTRDPEVSGETEQVVGACLLARREALFEAGLFDTNFYYIFEDSDLCYQMRKKGWRLYYVAEARVTHYGSASLKAWSSMRFFSTFISSMLYYFKKDGRIWQFFALRIFLVPLVCCRMFFILARLLAARHSKANDLAGAIREHLNLIKQLFGMGSAPWHAPRPVAQSAGNRPSR
jgi:N-acetylglucosaminyl-diphospho-decaprenol L-rhamnosyltransferase